MRTSSARLLALVSPVTLRSPGGLAEAVTSLDVLSGGRAVLGVGAGWDAAEHEAYGIPSRVRGEHARLRGGGRRRRVRRRARRPEPDPADRPGARRRVPRLTARATRPGRRRRGWSGRRVSDRGADDVRIAEGGVTVLLRGRSGNGCARP